MHMLVPPVLDDHFRFVRIECVEIPGFLVVRIVAFHIVVAVLQAVVVVAVAAAMAVAIVARLLGEETCRSLTAAASSVGVSIYLFFGLP